jgi:hypothetical protein
LESYGFHALEALQVFTERRRGGETGVRAVQALQGQQAEEAIRARHSSLHLLDTALQVIPEKRGQRQQADPYPTVFLIEYSDGLQAAVYMSNSHVAEFATAIQPAGHKPAATWFYLPKPQRDHFSFLCNHIEKMFLTGKASYPVERTLLTTGMLAFLMDSLHDKGRRIETPELANLRYSLSSES